MRFGDSRVHALAGALRHALHTIDQHVADLTAQARLPSAT
jgi:hypothetical protein